MRPYAERPGRLARQLLADLIALAWLAGVGWAAVTVHALVLQLRTAATGLSNLGTSISDAFATAAANLARVPLIGAQLAAGLISGRNAGTSLAELGARQVGTVSELALAAAGMVALTGLLPALVLWLPFRVHYTRMAGAAVAARRRDPDLLALRALTQAPVRRLRSVSDDPAGGWRRGDPMVVGRLVELELRRLGLRLPPQFGERRSTQLPAPPTELGSDTHRPG